MCAGFEAFGFRPLVLGLESQVSGVGGHCVALTWFINARKIRGLRDLLQILLVREARAFGGLVRPYMAGSWQSLDRIATGWILVVFAMGLLGGSLQAQVRQSRSSTWIS